MAGPKSNKDILKLSTRRQLRVAEMGLDVEIPDSEQNSDRMPKHAQTSAMPNQPERKRALSH